MIAPLRTKATLGLAATLLAIASFILSVSAGVTQYRYSWDGLAYIAVALKYNKMPANEIHVQAYRSIREQVPAAVFERLTADQPNETIPHRSAMYKTPKYFLQQLPYFTIKPFYPFLILVFHKAGLTLVDAMTLASLLGYAAMTVVVVLWLRTIFPMILAMPFAAILLTNPIFLPLALYPTPDSWAAFFLVLTFYLVSRERHFAALIIAIAAILVRPDASILVGLLSTVAVARKHWWRAVAAPAVASALVLGIRNISGAYPWTTFFYHSVVARLNEPATFRSPLGLVDYLETYWRYAQSAVPNNPPLLMLLALGIFGLLARWRRTGVSDPYFVVLAMAVGYVVLHWFVLPLGFPRYLAGSFIAIFISLAKNLSDAFSSRSDGATIGAHACSTCQLVAKHRESG